MIHGVFKVCCHCVLLLRVALSLGSCVAPTTTEEVGIEETDDRKVSPPGSESSKDHRYGGKEQSTEKESQDGKPGEISGRPAQGFWRGLRQPSKLVAKQVGYSLEAAAKCEVQEIWLILELMPKTLALCITLVWRRAGFK